MPRYTQAERPLRVDTVLGADVLLLHAYAGREAVSAPFHFDVDLLSEDPALSAADLLRTEMLITVFTPSGEKRYVHGLVKSFTELHRREDFTHYRAEVVPWLWFLSLTRDCRIFQRMTVLDIVEQVFGDLGYSDFDVRCTRSYPEREYCVQYRETCLAFVSRLLEEEGIFYFFEHTDSGHTMVLADDNTAFRPCPTQATGRMASEAAPDEDVVTSLERRHSVHQGVVTLQDYDFLQPTLRLLSQSTGEDGEEVYDYPGKYTVLDEGERYTRLLLEERELHGETIRGDSTCRGFESGYRFALTEHHRPDTNTDYVLVEVRHRANAGDFRSWDSPELDYRNDFVAVPHAVPYRPPVVTPKPMIRGTQPALVVGPSGEGVYVDSHGRIKGQFYWDREGQRDENSSCWIRVATPWAGKSWGAITLPRIGNEVVVGFEEGDPDRPLVVGSVYNAEQTPPFGLPDADIQMGMKSRSSPGGGGYNEITMTDTAGEEMITIHAQFDMDTSVEHDQRQNVSNNRTANVAVDETMDVGANQTLSVGGNQDVSVAGNQTVGVTGDQNVTVSGNRTTGVSGNDGVEVSGNRDVVISGNCTIDAGANLTLKAGANLTIEAGAQIVLTCGGTSITLTPGSLATSSPAITTTAGASHQIMGAVVMHNC